MNLKKEIKAGLAFGALLAVCMLTEPLMDNLSTKAVSIEPEQPVSVEIERIELPVEGEIETVETVEAAELSETVDQVKTKTKFISNPTNPTPLTDREYQVLLDTCYQNNIAPSLALGLIETESRFDKNARSKSGCYGYCQLNPKYHPANLTPEENIRHGIEYLASQFERYGNLESGLTAYNAGHDTRNTSYARKVLSNAEKWTVCD